MLRSRMKKTLLMNALTVVIAVLQALPTFAQSSAWNLDTYHLSLFPTESSPIRLYDMNSQYMGALARESKITIVVSGDIVRASLVNGQPDIRRVLQASAYRDINGNYALQLASNGDMRTQEGRQLAAGTRFMVAVNDFLALTPGSTAAEQEIDASAGMPEDATMIDEVEEDDEAESIVETQVEQFDIEMTRIRGREFPQEILSSPVCDCGPSCRFTSPYGPRRSRRTTNGRRMSSNHKGLDIGAPNGTPIIAAAPGCVSRIDRKANSGYGNTIYLAHGNGYETQYSHLTRFAPGIAAGKCFERGEQIGVSGSTGNVTGPHLHFGLLKDGVRVDPRPRFAASARTDRATRVRCSALLSYPGIDESMRTSLGIGGQGSFATTRRSTSSN